jgi:curved DNA-binding protein
MEYKDYYQTLGVARTASQAEIRKAYRKLARQHHPDVKPGDKSAEERFKDLNEANTVLSDPDKRKKYDALGANWEAFDRASAAGRGADPFGPGGAFGGSGGGGNLRYEFRTSDGADLGGFSDFFRMVFGEGAGAPAAGRRSGRTAPTSADLDDLFGGMSGGGGGGASAGRRVPSPAEATAELTLEEAFHGTSRIVEVDGKRLEVTIPKGVTDGSRIRIGGRGGDGRDLIVITRLRPHATFTRRGADLERELPITLREALLGGEVKVGTLKGRVLLTVPAGTQNGRTFRLTGQGMPHLNGGTSGDLYVRTRVVLPTNLSAEAKEEARRFLDLIDQADPR